MALGLRRRSFLYGCCGFVAMPLLAACGLFSKPVPQQPAPPPTPPLPTPTVTPTRAAVRIDAPVPPSVVATVSGTPRATPTTNPALRGTGQLLYTGALGGVGGIILADLATEKRQLLTVGNYRYPIWAPDGTRFAAIGAPTADLPIQQIAIFAADGRALARYALPISPPISPELLWSPNSRALAYQFSGATLVGQGVWIVDDNGQRSLPLDPNATIWRWTPTGRLAYFVLSAGNSSPAELSPVTVWTIDPAGSDPRQVTSGVFYPVALSSDGTTLYAIGGFRPTTSAGSQVGRITTLLALDTRRGTSRTLLDLNAVAAGETAWLTNVAVSEKGDFFAITRATIPVAAQQNTIGVVNELLVLDAEGQEVAHDLPWLNEFSGGWIGWSPRGSRVAYYAQGAGGGGAELRILELNGGARSVYPVRATDPRTGLLAAWSADDRWLAYVDAPPTGLLIAEAGKERAYPFAADGNYPAWRPQP